MPITEVQGPDGNVYEIEHPEGATDEQIIAYAQQNFGGEKQPPQERTLSSAAGEAVGNIIPSAGRLVGDIYTAVTNPGDTLDALNKTLGGYLRKGVDYFGGENVGLSKTEGYEQSEQYANLMNQYMAERYGGEQELLNTLATDPTGLAADIAGLLTGGGTLAAKVGGKTATVGRALAKAGDVVDPIRNMVRVGKGVAYIPKGAGNASRSFLGMVTGSGTKGVERATQGSEKFRKALSRQITETDIVKTAKDALSTFKTNRRTEYLSKLDDVLNNVDVLDDGSVYLKQIDISPATQRFNQMIFGPDGYNVARKADGSLDFANSSLAGDMPTQQAVRFIDDKLRAWGNDPQNLTPKGVDLLKRTMDNIYSESKNTKPIVTDVKNSLRQILNEKVDGYAEMTKAYHEQGQVIDQLRKTLSLEKGTPDEIMRKLNQSIKDNFDLRGQLVDAIDAELGTSLVDMIAGNQMSSWMAKNMVGRFAGMAAAGFAVGGGMSKEVIAALLMSSPKTVGTVLSKLGAPKAAVKRFIKQRPELLKQFNAINKAIAEGRGAVVPGARAAIPAVRLEQATGEYDNLIREELNNGM